MGDKQRYPDESPMDPDGGGGGGGGSSRERPHNTFSITLDGQSDQSGKDMPPKHPDGQGGSDAADD